MIVQTDALLLQPASVVICETTSDGSDASDVWVTVDPTEKNGLRTRSQVVTDESATVRRARTGPLIDRPDA